MKPTSEKRSVTLPNGWGQDSTTDRQRFEIEMDDVGVIRENYRGYRYTSHMFNRNDIGKFIEVMSAPGYTSWYFCDSGELPWQ